MLIVLTAEHKIPNEALVLNSLFDRGLETLHLRKPGFSEEDYKELLNHISPNFHNRIVLHEFHWLSASYNFKGIHLQEKAREHLGQDLKPYIKQMKNNGFTVSSSFHEKDEIEKFDGLFDYVFLSPVFDSISKQGYQGKDFEVHGMSSKVIGLGGVNETNADQIIQKGFAGIGVLGSVWTETPLTSFGKIYQAYQNASRS